MWKSSRLALDTHSAPSRQVAHGESYVYSDALGTLGFAEPSSFPQFLSISAMRGVSALTHSLLGLAQAVLALTMREQTGQASNSMKTWLGHHLHGALQSLHQVGWTHRPVLSASRSSVGRAPEKDLRIGSMIRVQRHTQFAAIAWLHSWRTVASRLAST